MTPAATVTSGSARDRLLEAALDRFGADGLVAVSLEDVRRAAGVSVGALYHHFADKTELIDALYLELTEDFQTGFLAELRAHATAERAIKAGVICYVRWISRNRAGAWVLLSHRSDSDALRELNRGFLSELRAWWDTHVHYGAVRPLSLDLVHALWLGPAHEYTRQWLDSRGKRSPVAMGQLLADAAWNTLKEPSPTAAPPTRSGVR